jgi:hypothetical protein
MVRKHKRVFFLANIAVFFVLCMLLGMRIWKACEWAATMSELEEVRIWCSQTALMEKMVVKRFGVPNWQSEGITAGVLLEELGVQEREEYPDNERKRTMYLLPKTVGLYGVLGFTFNPDGTVDDYACSYSKENEKLIQASKKLKLTSNKVGKAR